MGTLNEYWCRWVSTQPITTFEYHGPWWISGHADVGVIICAAICANSEQEALDAFCLAYDNPPEELLRFTCEELRSADPFSSRFPRRDWMVWPITPQEAAGLREQ